MAMAKKSSSIGRLRVMLGKGGKASSIAEAMRTRAAKDAGLFGGGLHAEGLRR